MLKTLTSEYIHIAKNLCEEEIRQTDKETSMTLQCPNGPSNGDITNRDEKNKELGIIAPVLLGHKATEQKSLNKVLFVTQENEALIKVLIFLDQGTAGKRSANIFMQVSELENGNQGSNLGQLS